MTDPGNMSDQQEKSWADPYRAKMVECEIKGERRQVYLVGEIFFLTNEHTLDSDDISKLDLLVNEYEPLLEETDKLELFFLGHADFRASDKYNMRLSERRANEVHDHFTKQTSFASSDNWTHEVDPKGESESVQPGDRYKGVNINRGSSSSVLNILMEFRKVQIYANKNIPIRLGFDYQGQYGDIYMLSLEHEEINNGGKVYAYQKEELKATFEEMKLKSSGKVKPPDDPKEVAEIQRVSKMSSDQFEKEKRSLITAIVRVEYSEYQSGGKTICRVNTVVMKNRDKTELFRASIEAEAKIGRSGVWYLSSPPENDLQVWRKAEPGKTVHDYKYAREVQAPAGLDEKLTELYNKLREHPNFPNITERVKSKLAPMEKAPTTTK